MAAHPAQVRRRLVPDEAQLQIILGSLLGEARIEGAAGDRRLHIAHSFERVDYVRWKYERLMQLADTSPSRVGDRLAFRTIAHPIFDDLTMPRSRIRDLLRPLGLAVWMADLGRVELRPELFVPVRTLAACA